jgi:hypothetical protein
VLTLGALAVAVGFATRGNAASIDSCPATAPSTSPCWQLFAYPSVVSTGGNGGVLVAKFQNEGNGTANHVTVSPVTGLPDGTTFTVSTTQGTCNNVLPCVIGQVPGHGKFRVFIQYVLPAGADASPGPNYTPSIQLTFDERNGTSPTSDKVIATTGVTAVTASGSSTSTCLTDPQLTVSTTGQNAIVTNTTAANGLPCLPTTTTIEGQSGPSGSNVITSFTLDGASQGFVTVEIDYATLASGVTFRTLQLLETEDPAPAVPNKLVDPCLANGLPQTANTADSTNSCVFKRAKYLSKGAAITLHVVSSGVDPRYGY